MSKIMSENEVRCINTPNLPEKQAITCTNSMLLLFILRSKKKECE